MTQAGPDRTVGQDRSTLSPREAARIAKVGKSTIMRAIEATHLEARRDNRNQWRIERNALDRWTVDRPGPDRDSPMDRTGADRSTLADDLDKARLTIAQMEARLEERAALVRAAEADRDRWRALAEKLTDRPNAPSVAPASSLTSPPRRWWLWRRG